MDIGKQTDSWIQTYTGVSFPILEPTPDLVNIEDIAHALSNLCRFTGHTSKFYSVAQHSIIVSYHVNPEFALSALLHDATEAYVGDIARPLKYCGLIDKYQDIEYRIWLAVAQKFKLSLDIDKSIKEADNRALVTEKRDLMEQTSKPWTITAEPLPFKIVALPPETAKIQFIARFNHLMRERNANVQSAS